MTILDRFLRVGRARRCPICGKPDWCLVELDFSGDVVRVICARIESSWRYGDAGWLHVLRSDHSNPGPPIRRPTTSIATSSCDLSRLARGWQTSLTEQRARALAGCLGIWVSGLRRLGLGWTGSAWSFPMYGDEGTVCGIHLRLPDGQKRAVRGSRLGLFLPEGLQAKKQLFVLEGASDTAAFLDLGCPAIGRPSCNAGGKLVVHFVQATQPQHVIVVADADGSGRKGAARLAGQLRVVCRSVRILEPGQGAKDARAWVNAGATPEEVLTGVEAVEPLHMGVTVRRRTRA